MKIKFLFMLICITFTLLGCSQTTAEEPKKEEDVKEESLDPTKLLPIGTVVKLSKVDKPVMIYGYNQIQVSTNKQYDYIGVPYPEGNISPDYNVFFNRNLIKEVLHNGYVTEEDKKIREEADREENTY
ncbi:DUF4176 domain-containing protein [Rossellomorea vietnamensis]|uniref:DUF4176 domain-containing protein n=1 Tax=Rossellomorea vietnamensis TaxID=218284 RepID=UPI001CCAD5AE|nr:DUF4176 domain-containing protein [Rossellomorea vietnamensis]MCA0150350.1 DUF4176 domain-containing protein [Rossellomorea vietnamensis]